MAAAEQDLLEDKIQSVRRRDRRFSRHAYYFVLDALDYTMSTLGRDALTGEERHVGGRELLGETIMTLAGDVYITELTLAMPDCEAVGDILVLKNLLTDLTIAAAN